MRRPRPKPLSVASPNGCTAILNARRQGTVSDASIVNTPRSAAARCWPAWYEARQTKAVSALAVMGISAPVGRQMKREEQSKHLSSDVAREVHTAKIQIAFQRQLHGG
jgi:hypothetical protein